MQAMKYLKHTLYAALAAVAVTACTGDFEEYNTNPNKLTQGSITPISMLEPLLYSATNSFDNYMLAILAGWRSFLTIRPMSSATTGRKRIEKRASSHEMRIIATR